MEDNQGGGVGAFAEEEANKKRQKKEDSVSIKSSQSRWLLVWEPMLLFKAIPATVILTHIFSFDKEKSNQLSSLPS